MYVFSNKVFLYDRQAAHWTSIFNLKNTVGTNAMIIMDINTRLLFKAHGALIIFFMYKKIFQFSMKRKTLEGQVNKNLLNV